MEKKTQKKTNTYLSVRIPVEEKQIIKHNDGEENTKKDKYLPKCPNTCGGKAHN